MLKNSTKMIAMTTTIMSTIMAISSENWINLWLSLEINMISFLVMLKEKNKSSSKSMMTYFLIQSMSSIVFIFSIMMNPMIMISENQMSKIIYMMMMTSMMMKMGAAPLHMWFTWMMTKLSWLNCLMISTWQKIIPLFILSNMNNNFMMNMFLMTSIMVGAIGGINQTSLKKIIAFSSINHMGWMFMGMKFSNEMWIKYLIIYTMMIMMIMFFFSKKKINFINQMNMQMKTKMEKITMIMMMLSLGGMPPMIGFMPKWMIINLMIDKTTIMMSMIMIMMSMITLFYYVRIMSIMMMEFYTKNKWNMEEKNYFKMEILLIMTNVNLPLIMMINLS
uniref:NADH dehydrogenase subunit 2 n=1 Tax=Thetibates serena TaxID=2866982 RepID=UPI001EDF77DC|nr:NADH dehydrogenase subunit 2 [Thetibates serena]UIG88161.1 NADH dehydrogenase subunit 2 [Thetibates serena]UIG88168.1 NADH dehydrogenase subunit 2 [Thetibates serena]